jgi:hypothetical protein
VEDSVARRECSEGAAYHVLLDGTDYKRKDEFRDRDLGDPEDLADHIEEVKNLPETQWFEGDKGRILWANTDFKLAGVDNPDNPRRSTVISFPTEEKANEKFENWKSTESTRLEQDITVSAGPTPEILTPKESSISNTPDPAPENVPIPNQPDPDQVRAELLAQRQEVETALTAAEEKLEALRESGASEAQIEAVDAECVSLSDSIRDIDNDHIKQAVRDPDTQPLFDSMTDEIEELRSEYQDDRANLDAQADEAGWDDARRESESEKLEKDWDAKLDDAYPTSEKEVEPPPPPVEISPGRM